jgi:hypothetical protein
MVVRLFLALPAAALLLAAADSHALCLPTLHHINIGSSKVGTGCDYVYADIQTAITNACPNTVISITNGVTLANVALEINGKSNLTLVGLAAGRVLADHRAVREFPRQANASSLVHGHCAEPVPVRCGWRCVPTGKNTGVVTFLWRLVRLAIESRAIAR